MKTISATQLRPYGLWSTFPWLNFKVVRRLSKRPAIDYKKHSKQQIPDDKFWALELLNKNFD